jgi:DNA-binding NtrC family response regulator
MKYKTANPNCKCGEPKRPKQQTCRGCHAKSQRLYRKEMQVLAQASGSVFVEKVRAYKRQLLLNAIRDEKGNLCRAAIRLGVHRNSVNRIMREVRLSGSEVTSYLKGEA